MRTNQFLIAILGAAIACSACATPSGTGAATGAAGGAVVGGIIGGSSGALLGAAIGGVAGYGVGRQVEIEDERRAQAAFEANQRAAWRSAQSGNYYEVVPTRTVYRDGYLCREFMMRTTVDGRTHQTRGVACDSPDGTWIIET